MIDIKDIQGNVIYSTPINEGSKRKFELMQSDYITLKFSLSTPVSFPLGCYVDDTIGLFEVIDIYKPKYNSSTGGYDYELQLDAYYRKWNNKIFKFTPETGGQEASWSLTASLDVHLGVFLRNLKALGYTYRGTDFEFSIDSTVEDKAIGMTYDNMNMLDALSSMAERWDCEWWVTDNIIHFGRCEYGTAVDFELNKNVAEMTRSESKSTYATRIYAFGSTKNIPANYRPVDETTVVNGVVQRRLMLPSGTPYVDAYEGMSEAEAVEQVVVFDEIYPRTQGSIDSVETYDDTVENEDGTTTTETFYRFKDSSIIFSKDYILEGEELKIKFESGSLNGMEFGLVFNPNSVEEKLSDGSWNPEAQLFEIVANEDYGRKLPDSTLKPSKGDKYVLSGWDSTKIAELGLVDAAEQELLEKAKEYVKKTQVDPNTYNCKMMSDYMYGLDDEGNLNTNYAKVFEVGDKVNLINAGFFENGRQSRIIGYEYYLDKPYDNTVFTVGETASYSRIGDLESKVESLVYGGVTYTGGGGSGVYVIGTNDSTSPSNRNVFSALKSLQTFLRKDIADTANGIITFLKGLRVGKFITGLVGGSGASIYEDSNGRTVVEADRAMFRDELIVPKITYNCIDVVSGDKANTFAYGTIKSVDTENQIIELDLLEDEYGTPHIYDICRGTFHFIEGGNNTEYSWDDNGFHKYSGYSTAYFTPTKILVNEAGAMKFKYALQEGTTTHPCKGMIFYAYGNFIDENRQSISYETREYQRYLEGVNTWVIDPDKNIVSQFGDIEGLTIGGVTMHGHGSYQHNTYLSGTFIQFTKEQKEELQGKDAYSVNLTDYEAVIVTDNEGNLITSLTEQMNVVSGDKNIVTTDTDGTEKNVVATRLGVTTRIQAFKGNQELYYSEGVQSGSFIMTLNCVGCTAYVESGVIFVESIDTAVNSHYIDITVNCEGNVTFDMTYTISTIRQAESHVTVDLDNEMESVPCDGNGNVTVFPESGIEVNATMFYGNETMYITEAWAEVPSNIGYDEVVLSDDQKKATLIITSVGQDAAESNNIIIHVKGKTTASSTEEYERTAKFVLNKVAMGENAVMYRLNPSVSSVKISDSGEYSVSVVNCLISEANGKTYTSLDNLDGTSLKMEYRVDSEDWSTYEYASYINIKLSSATQQVSFKLYYGDVLIDVENIPIVSDGNSPVFCDLDNEMAAVACDGEGKITGVAKTSTTYRMWGGNTELELTSLDAVSSDSNTSVTSDKSTGLVTVTVTDDSPSKVEVTITGKATYQGVEETRSIVYTVNKINAGKDALIYQLNPSDNAISVDADGNITPSNIYCYLTKRKGTSEIESITSGMPDGYEIHYWIDDNSSYVSLGNISSAISTSGVSKKIRFELYYGATLVDIETVPVAKDGKDSTIYRIAADATVIRVGDEYSVKTIFPSIIKTKGDSTTELYYTPDGYSLVYSKDYGSSYEVESTDYTYGISVYTSDTDKVEEMLKFTLFKGGTKVDTLMIPVIKDGSIGETTTIWSLNPSTDAVKVDADGNYSSDTITVTLLKRAGTSVVATDTLPTGYSLKYRIDDKVDTSGNEVWTDFDMSSSISTSSIGSHVVFRLYDDDGTVIDTEDIPVLYDGKGESALVADLTNDAIAVPCDVNGNIKTSISTSNPLTTTMKIYHGTTEKELDSLSVSGYDTSLFTVTTDYTTGLVSITKMSDSAPDISEFTIKGSTTIGTSNIPLEKVFTVHKSYQGATGDQGENGVYMEEIYKASDSQPSTPTGTTSIPSGWSLDVPNIIGNISDVSYGSGWEESDGYRISPTTEHNGSSYEKVSFNFDVETVVEITLTAYSEPNYDFGYIGVLGVSAANTGSSRYLSRVSGNGESVTALVTVPAGSQYLYIKYVKDGSTSSYGDYIKYKVSIPGVVWYSRAQATWNSVSQQWEYGTWSIPKIYDVSEGTEELYLLTATKTAPSTPSSPSYSGYIPLLYAAYDEETEYSLGNKVTYNGKSWEYIYGESTTGNTPSSSSVYWKEIPSWTITPSDVTDEYPYQYWTQRKMVNGVWGEWNTPTIFTLAGKGEKGENGYFPRDKGIFTQGENYYYAKDATTGDIYRDKIVYYIDGAYFNFMVKTRNDSGYITDAPTSSSGDDNWEVMSQYRTLIADTLFGTNANMGGFMVTDEKFRTTSESAANGKPHFQISGSAPNMGMNLDDGSEWSVNEEGVQTIGNSDGERIVIDPHAKALSMFDEDGNERTVFDGKGYTYSELIPSGGSTISINSSYGTNTSGKKEYSSSSFWSSTSDYTITSASFTTTSVGTLILKFTGLRVTVSQGTTNVDTTKPYILPQGKVQIILKSTINSVTTTKVIAQQLAAVDQLGGSGDSGTISGEKSISLGIGTHVIYAKVYALNGSASGTTAATGYWTVSSIQFSAESYMSRHFANGMMLSKSTTEYFMAMVEDDHMNVEAVTGNSGIRLNNGAIQLRYNGSNWFNMPITLLFACVTIPTGASTGASITYKSFDGSTVTVSSTTKEGVFNITIPSSWGVTSTNTNVQATGFGKYRNPSSSTSSYSVCWATVVAVNSTSIQVVTSYNNNTEFDHSGFYLEVKKFQ